VEEQVAGGVITGISEGASACGADAADRSERSLEIQNLGNLEA
jgi:hypothetical protein